MFFKRNSYLLLLIFISSVFLSQEKEVVIPSYPDSLYGSLLLSKSDYLCIIHAGSGPTDRNGNNDFGLETNCYKKLADSLFAHKISTFRYDKRGIGKSKNNLVAEDSLSIFTLVNDLSEIIKFFSKPPYQFKTYILIGHSEGALIATLAAQNNPKVMKLILLSGAGFRADTILKRQLSNIESKSKSIIYSIIDTLASGKRVDNVPPSLYLLFREAVQNYMISWLPIDPAVELSKCKQKVLIIQGENDIQVGVIDAKRLKEYKPNAEMIILPNMNHVLVDCSKDKERNKATYSNPDLPLSKDLIKYIVEFINKK